MGTFVYVSESRYDMKETFGNLNDEVNIFKTPIRNLTDEVDIFKTPIRNNTDENNTKPIIHVSQQSIDLKHENDRLKEQIEIERQRHLNEEKNSNKLITKYLADYSNINTERNKTKEAIIEIEKLNVQIINLKKELARRQFQIEQSEMEVEHLINANQALRIETNKLTNHNKILKRFDVEPGRFNLLTDEDIILSSPVIYVFYGLKTHILKIGRAQQLQQRLNLYQMMMNSNNTHFDTNEDILALEIIPYDSDILNAIESVYRTGFTVLLGQPKYGREWWELPSKMENKIDIILSQIKDSNIIHSILKNPINYPNQDHGLNNQVVTNVRKKATTEFTKLLEKNNEDKYNTR